MQLTCLLTCCIIHVVKINEHVCLWSVYSNVETDELCGKSSHFLLLVLLGGSLWWWQDTWGRIWGSSAPSGDTLQKWQYTEEAVRSFKKSKDWQVPPVRVKRSHTYEVSWISNGILRNLYRLPRGSPEGSASGICACFYFFSIQIIFYFKCITLFYIQ